MKTEKSEEPDSKDMVEQFMLEHKNQFDVFDYEEDGSFKPIFMVGKCQAEEASSPVQVPTTVIE